MSRALRAILPVVVAVVGGGLALTGIVVHATTVLPLTLPELVEQADVVFESEVVDTRPRLSQERDGVVIITDVTFRVQRVFKGTASPMTVLSFVGGTVGDRTLTVEGMPRFAPGDRDIVFAQSGQTISPVVGLMHGRFRVIRDAPSGDTFVQRHDGLAVRSIASLGGTDRRPTQIGERPMTLQAFQRAIVSEVARQRRLR